MRIWPAIAGGALGGIIGATFPLWASLVLLAVLLLLLVYVDTYM
jgi:hypothetical protein